MSRDPEDVLQTLLVLERHQGQGGLGGASWDSLPSRGWQGLGCCSGAWPWLHQAQDAKANSGHCGLA